MKPSSVPPFSELIGNCHRSAVHLELRDTYEGYDDGGRFAEWKREGGITPAFVEDFRAWTDLVRETVARGVEMRRVRVVSVPVTEYIRFEYEAAHLNQEAGEQVRWLPRSDAATLLVPGADLWIFDGRLIRFGHFTGDGALVRNEMCQDPSVIKKFSEAFEAVWQRATPHERFTV
ncbi:hypothetical protein NGF19_01970 [Streptomyces sp. RY43-2]|uniref:DUF6879 domain-containing protein n=1 Tax=Streptomyces macrolidinus TaxID=2952607 RepID=A0ABT0Z715_9ACTN|nr:DUF6879 family protein [Streptomyces macrolidinus]MCN9239560.1 hypothetical protein [Streptomyces macrolidinus]